MKTLIIDDDEGTRLVLRALLEARGHEVIECATAEEAVAAHGRDFAPMVFLDLFLPGMDGFEFCRWLRRQPEGDRQYILAGTSSNDPDDLGRILEAGADDYITKPYEPRLLDVRLQVAGQQLRNLAARKQLETDLRREREHLAFLAEHDPLTHLRNRAGLVSDVEAAVAAARDGIGSAVIYADLDNFKIVNDTVGHAAGDRLLGQVASILRGAIRSSDRAYRFGGDEFVLLLNAATLADAAAVAERIRSTIEAFAFTHAGKTFAVGASIGIALVDGSMTAEHVMAAADSASYRAKRGGRNQVAFHEPGDGTIASLRQDTDWAARIKDALRHERFTLLFQPVVRLSTGRVEFYEVLLRMEGENEALIPPGAFLPPAERFHLMPEIDRYVVRHTAQQLKGDPELTVSVNLSGQSVSDSAFGDDVVQVFEAAGISPDRVIFEVTETEVISNVATAQRFIARLSAAGFRFALDDFGAGFSSFKYLKELQVSHLKIDGSFIRGGDSDPASWTFVEVINQLAHAFGLCSVAEWVEDEATLQRLREIGVDYAQGYHLGRPRLRPVAAET